MRTLLLITYLALAWPSALAIAEPDGPATAMFRCTDMPDLPAGLRKAFAGRSGGAYLVAGGVINEGGHERANKQVFVLMPDAKAWRSIELPPFEGVGGCSINVDDAMICIGGLRAGKAVPKVTRLRWRDGQIELADLPSLPEPCNAVSATLWNKKLFVYGTPAETHLPGGFWTLSTTAAGSAWRQLPSCPGAARVAPAMTALEDGVYLFGGIDATDGHPLRDAYRFTESQGWTQLTEAPVELGGAAAAACGHSHVLLLGGTHASDAIMAYHYITDRWVRLGSLPHAVQAPVIFEQGNPVTLLVDNRVVRIEAQPTATKYGWMDHVVVAAYLLVMVGIGFYFARGKKSTNDFFRGGQRVPWWASGLSLFATGASAISLMGMPAKSYAVNWIYFSGSLFLLLVLPVKLAVFVPIARRLNVRTANEYVERRFGLGLRMFTSIVFCLNQIISRMASVLLLPSIALSTVTGMHIETSILLMGLLTTLYTTLGGLEAVVWTDVVQAVVMIGAVIGCIAVALLTAGITWDEAWHAVDSAHKLRMFDWRLDWTMPVVWVMFLSTIVSGLGAISDQNFIQRVQCTADEKQAKRAVTTSLFVAVPLNCLLFTFGTVLFIFYRNHPASLNPSMKTDGIFALFVAQQLPRGLAGLVVAGLFAAAMGPLSAGIHSVANLGVEDFYRRLRKGVTDRECMKLARRLTVIFGLMGTGAALWMGRSTATSVWDIAMTTTALITNPIIGIFTLGMFSRRANSAGVIAGVVASMAAVLWVRNYTSIVFFLYVPIGVGVCMMVGYLCSLLIRGSAKDLTGLTVFTLSKFRSDSMPMRAEPMAAGAAQ